MWQKKKKKAWNMAISKRRGKLALIDLIIMAHTREVLISWGMVKLMHVFRVIAAKIEQSPN
jgi:hypothetical protein